MVSYIKLSTNYNVAYISKLQLASARHMDSFTALGSRYCEFDPYLTVIKINDDFREQFTRNVVNEDEAFNKDMTRSLRLAVQACRRLHFRLQFYSATQLCRGFL